MSFCYIGRAACGCIRAVVLDEPNHQEDVAKDVSDFIKSGLTIERVQTETVNSAPWEKPECEIHRRKPKNAELFPNQKVTK